MTDKGIEKEIDEMETMINEDDKTIEEKVEEVLGENAPSEVVQLLENHYRENAKRKVMQSGLFFPSRPQIPTELLDNSGNISLPQDITTITDDKLGLYLTVFSALSAYAEGVVAVTDIDWTTSDRVSAFAERLEIFKLPKEQQKNDDLRYGAINRLKYIRDLRQKEMQDLANFKLSSGLLRGYEKSIASLSREITRRANTFKHSNYEDNMSKRGSYND